MRPFSHSGAIDDLSTLDALTTNIPFLHGCYQAIEKAYQAYINNCGSPQLKAIGLSQGQTVCLHKAYEGGTQKYGLDWIPQLRDVMLGSCPMCGSLTLGTVEHYLPKTPFPEFSVFSWNLIPSCSSCNQKRGSKHVNGIGYQLLHPMFDKVLLGKLGLVTKFDTTGLVTQFALGFNEHLFSAHEQKRIAAHINMCVDLRAFKLATQVQISMVAARVAGKALAKWKSVIKTELTIMESANVGYGWGASCLRGLLEVSEIQLSSILTPKILK
ncbi:hypothetical protein GR140_02525 [Pseudomonas putida]|uniref:hypothetical protein n=1 Tax=Pseudomonas putida TaxID=303 RepID=UPI001BAEA010|nr:hypothetical protein [Pseudomonas putida]QUG87675.1 hypothetical protein GR140_02525 [Pseudomonas putida]